MRRIAIVPVILVLAWLPGPVRSDAIPPEPEECPRGTMARSDHGGPRCEPRFCGRDVAPPGSVDCGPGASCREALVEHVVRAPIDWGRPGFPTVTPYRGDCDCPPEVCQRDELCVPDDLAVRECPAPAPQRGASSPARSSRSGCASCSAPAGRDRPWRLGALVLVVLAWTSRRRDRLRSAG